MTRPVPADPPYKALLRRLAEGSEVRAFLKTDVETKRDAWLLVLQGSPNYDFSSNPWRSSHTLTRWVWYRKTPEVT